MSAYIVSNDTLDLLTSVLCEWKNPHESQPLSIFHVQQWQSQPLDPNMFVLKTTAWGTQRVEIGRPDGIYVKRELYLANAKSVKERYGNTNNYFDEVVPEFKPISMAEATISEAAGALKCYEYQSCEFDGWDYSFASALCDQISRKLIRKMGGDNWNYERPATETISILDMMKGGNRG